MEPKRPTAYTKSQTQVDPEWKPKKAPAPSAEDAETFDEASLPRLPLLPRLAFPFVALIFIAVGTFLLVTQTPERLEPEVTVEVTGLAPGQEGEVEDPEFLTASGEKVIWTRSIAVLGKRLEEGLPFTLKAHPISKGFYKAYSPAGLEIFILFAFFFLMITSPIVIWKYGHKSGNTLTPIYKEVPRDLRNRLCKRILWMQGILLVVGWGAWFCFLGWSPWPLVWLVPLVVILLCRRGYAWLIPFGILGIFLTVGVGLITAALTIWYAPTAERAFERVTIEPLFYRVETRDSENHGTWTECNFLVRYERQGQLHYGVLDAEVDSPLARRLKAPGARLDVNFDPQAVFSEQLVAGSFPKDRVERFWILLAMGACFCIMPLLFGFLNNRRSKKRRANG